MHASIERGRKRSGRPSQLRFRFTVYASRTRRTDVTRAGVTRASAVLLAVFGDTLRRASYRFGLNNCGQVYAVRADPDRRRAARTTTASARIVTRRSPLPTLDRSRHVVVVVVVVVALGAIAIARGKKHDVYSLSYRMG